MRVLVLSNLYPPNAMGGYELSCRDVVDSWRARGHEVSVLTTAEPVAGVVEPEVSQPHVRRELEWYWSAHAFHRPSLVQRWALERRNQERLRAALHELRPDVVSVWHMGGMSLSLLAGLDRAGVPAVLNICDEWPDYGPKVDAWSRGWGRVPSLLRPLGTALCGVPTTLADLDRHAHAFVSAYTRDRLRERTRWSFPRATVVGSGVDGLDFPLVREVAPRPWSWELLAVGRVEPRKGFDSAVRALAHLPAQTRLRIAGVAEPTHLSELRVLAAEVGAADRLVVEAVPRGELRARYAAADVVLFPSRWDEPFGLVPLEAMTQATPVVATRKGGSAEFLEDGANCLEVPADDPMSLAAAVHRLALDPGLRRRLAEGGLLTAAAHTLERLADVLEQMHAQEAR
ncbi:MAG: hypothetical protein JWO12_2184 [Frankiales bacterium]|nr:hypothetical protein [Frankiales bacterium]